MSPLNADTLLLSNDTTSMIPPSLSIIINRNMYKQ